MKQLLEINWWEEIDAEPGAPVKDAKLLRDMFIAGLTADEGAAE